jgi:hypothetical protein
MLRLTGSRLEEAAARYGKGESIAGLAAAFNICPTTVSRALRACGTKMRRRGRPSGRSLRVAALAASVVTMRSQGIAFVEIAAALGITASRAGQLAGEPLAITKTTETLPAGHLVRRARRRAYRLVAAGKLPHPSTVPCRDGGCRWKPGGPRHEFWIEPRLGGGWRLVPLCIPHRRRRARLLQAGRSVPGGQRLEGLTSRVPCGTSAEAAR